MPREWTCHNCFDSVVAEELPEGWEVDCERDGAPKTCLKCRVEVFNRRLRVQGLYREWIERWEPGTSGDS